MHFRLAQPAALWLLPLIPATALLLVWADRRRRAALQRFSRLADPGVDWRRRRLNRVALVCALSLLVAALARPVWSTGPAAPPPENADVVFLLDVSRSMLASDAAPTRLERAKSIVRDLVQQFRTERAALVTFAGNCAVECPLTIDYAYFRERLDAADWGSATRGGTRIGDAVAFTLRTAVDDVQRGRKRLVVLSDGGDQDDTLEAAARLATERHVGIVSVGIGDDLTGALVPVSASDRSPFLYRGRPVSTRLESSVLETLARLNTGGVYVQAGTGSIDAADVYHRLLSATSPPAGGPPRAETDGYPILLALAIAALLAEFLLSDRKAQAAVLLLIAIPFGGRSAEEDPLAQADRLFRSGHYDSALYFYLRAEDAAPHSPEIVFDVALALYKTGNYEEAASTFERAAAQSRDPRFRARCKFGHANAGYRIAMRHSEKLYDFQQALSLLIPIYREALALDPGFTDSKYNIEVVKRKLAELQSPLRAASSRVMAQTREDVVRRKDVDASQILDEARNGKKMRGQVGRPTIDTDW